MRGSKKSKSVTWAPDESLCQVRLFLSEDSPSQVGLGAQDHLQAKASWLLHSTGMGFDDHLPPGFEGAHSVNILKEVSEIPLVKWQRPPKFILNPHWQVVAGEESKEADVQTQRELRVLEAIYPHLSAIPPSPSVSPDVETYHVDDHQTPVVPITAIEDEDANDPSSNLVAPINDATTSQLPMLPPNFLAPGNHQTSQGSIPSGLRQPTSEKPSAVVIPGVEPDVVAAASAAFTAIMRSNEHGSLIDPELLVKILSSPKLIEKLVADYGAPGNPPTQKPVPPLMNLSVPQSGPPPLHTNRIEPEPPLSAATTVHFHPVTNPMASAPVVVQMPAPALKTPSVKDINYYKSLIQLHGGERPEVHEQTIPQFGNRQEGIKTEQIQSSKPRDSKPKIKKPCIYFNSSRGCKHGANCAYQHDISAQQRIGGTPELQGAKRMKLDREITGRT